MLSLGVSSGPASRWTCMQRAARPPVQSPGVWRGWDLEPAPPLSVCTRWVPESWEGRASDTDPPSGSRDSRREGREAARWGEWGRLPEHLWLGPGRHQGLRGIQQGWTWPAVSTRSGVPLASLLPGLGTWDSRPAASRHSWPCDKTGRASPGGAGDSSTRLIVPSAAGAPPPPPVGACACACAAPRTRPPASQSADWGGHKHSPRTCSPGGRLSGGCSWRHDARPRCGRGAARRPLPTEGVWGDPKPSAQRAGEPCVGSWLSGALRPGP